jgi:hypothetical protein
MAAMGLSDDLAKEVKEIFATSFTVRDGQKVPEPQDVKLDNDAVKLEGTVLYADLAESTNLVNNYFNWFAAEVYKVSVSAKMGTTFSGQWEPAHWLRRETCLEM